MKISARASHGPARTAAAVFGLLIAGALPASQSTDPELLLSGVLCQYMETWSEARASAETLQARRELRARCEQAVAQKPIDAALPGGAPKAILAALAAPAGYAVKIADRDLAEVLERAARSADPETLYFLGIFANSRAATEYVARSGAQQFLGRDAAAAWFELACARGLDCSDSGLIATLNCANGICKNPLLLNRESARMEVVTPLRQAIEQRLSTSGRVFPQPAI